MLSEESLSILTSNNIICSLFVSHHHLCDFFLSFCFIILYGSLFILCIYFNPYSFISCFFCWSALSNLINPNFSDNLFISRLIEIHINKSERLVRSIEEGMFNHPGSHVPSSCLDFYYFVS